MRKVGSRRRGWKELGCGKKGRVGVGNGRGGGKSGGRGGGDWEREYPKRCTNPFNIPLSTPPLLTILLLLFITQTLAFYPHQCKAGYFGQNETCTPCNSSCKTCEDETLCTTCEDFMWVNEVTGLCETCGAEEYYDPIGGRCLECNGVCAYECMQREGCFECPSGKVFDAEEFECVESCDLGNNKVMVTSEKMNIGKICKTLNIYIDPDSREPIELGTLKYPYRTFKSAASEILNHYSNTQAEVTIYVKDGYIETDTFYFMNMTNVKITAHPEYKIMNKRAQISFTSQPQHGISKKARFHLLRDVPINHNQFVAIEETGETEKSGLSKDKMGIMAYRTSLEISDIEFHSNDLKHFCAPIYLQDKDVKFYNLDFNVTGTSLDSQDPMNVHLENISVDISRQDIFFYPLLVFCNYPEAFTRNIVYVKNVTTSISIKKTVYNYSLLNSALPGNHTMIDIDCGNLPVNDEIDMCIVVGYGPTCIPNDDLLQLVEYESVNSDGRPLDAGIGNILITPVVAFTVPYRPVYINMTNFNYINITQHWSYRLFYLYSIGVEAAEITNFMFHNISSNLFVIEVSTIKDIKVKNLTFEDSLNHTAGILQITAYGNVEFDGVIVRNFNNKGAYNSPLFALKLPATSSVIMKDFSFENAEIPSVSLFSIDAAPVMMTVENFKFKDCKTPNGDSLLSFLYINSIKVSNITVENVHPFSAYGTTENIIRIASLNYEEMHTAEFSDITILNSSLSLFGVGSLTMVSNSERYISFSNIRYSECSIPSSRSLVSTDRLVGDLSLNIQFNNLRFEDIEFATTGSLIELKHQLPTVVKFDNCSVSRVNSGSIQAEGRKTSSNIDTKFKFMNSIFSDITLIMTPFISTSQNLVYEIQNSSFTGFTSMSVIAGIFRASDRSVITIESSLFQNNSAVLSPIFKADTEASIICTNCKISNNFGVTSGVFEIESGAVLKILQSEIYENYAIQYPVGTFLSAFTPSIISNTKIYSNNAIFESDLTEELSSSCVKLCFLSELIKNYLTDFNFTAITQTDTLIQVLLAEIHIINNTQIYESTSVVYCLSSELLIENSFISEIGFIKSPINLVSTIASVNNLTISNCSKLDTQDDIAFIQITSGTLNSSGLNFSNSNFRVAQLSFSSCIMSNIQLTDVVNDKGLIGCLKCQQFELDSLLLQNSYSVSNPLLSLQETLNVELRNIKLSGYQYKLAQFSLSNITVIENLEISNGKQTLEFTESNLLMMKNCSFSNNEETGTSRGGAVQIFNSKINIYNTTFRNNSAYSGGAITFECTSMANCELNIRNSEFFNNNAKVKGGAIYYNYNYPRINNTDFSNNKADYGPNFASYPAKIGLVDTSQGEDIILDNIGSGITIDQILTLAIYDVDNQIMNLDNSSQITITRSDAAKIRGYNTASVSKGIAQFDNIAAIATGGIRSSNFTLSSKSINIGKVKEVLGTLYIQEDLQIKFRYCQPGERILGDECTVCVAGTYSLKWNATECVECQHDAQCLGSNEISVSSGYWRRFQNSTKIVECIVEKACEGGYVDYQNEDQTSNPTSIHPVKCAEGYSGNLCSQCVVTEDIKYEKVNDYECQKCPNQIENAFKVLFTLLLVLLFFILMVVINVRKTNESELSVLLRILTNYIQLITVAASMTNGYPAGFLTLISPMRLFGGSTDVFLSFDCFIKDTEVQFLFNSNAIFKLFLMSILPIILFVITALMWVIIRLIKPAWCTNMKRTLVISFLTIGFILYTKLTERSISLFKCIEIDEGYKVAKVDTNIECFSPTHLKWCLLVAVPILAVWIIGCPLAVCIAIYKEKDKPDSKIMEYFLMLYQGLKPEAIYWEFVNTIRKIAILLCLLFELNVTINLSLIILLLSARLQIKIKPYKNFENNKIEFLSSMGVVSTVVGALVYSRYVQHDILNSVVFISIVMINFKFLIEWLFRLMQIYQEKNKYARLLIKCLTKIMCKKIPKSAKQESKKKNSTLRTPKNEANMNEVESSSLKKRVYKKPRPKKKRRRFKNIKRHKKAQEIADAHPLDSKVADQGIKPPACFPCIFIEDQ
ncbi:unnamed protein product [Moneuplotes crassus]|uniref:Uncharacterized protein n=1 Tax=Euplotes crassus TaxID=5936 RepID=A0AAD1U476_EUPCR|nr:unnamed protein product [Moneuplotes crassus]